MIFRSAELVLSGIQIAETPLPATFPLFATGLGALGLIGWRRKRKAADINRVVAWTRSMKSKLLAAAAATRLSCLVGAGLLFSVLAQPASAVTYTLPINTDGTFFIGGSILNPTPISVSISTDAVLGPSQFTFPLMPDAGWDVGVDAHTVNQETNFWYSSLFVSHGARNGPSPPLNFIWGSLEVADFARMLVLEAHVSSFNVAPFNYQITINLPDDLVVTPLPAALPLFATGLGALGLLVGRRKRGRYKMGHQP
jgi:hypothetical protein